jgi:hypothetical protein
MRNLLTALLVLELAPAFAAQELLRAPAGEFERCHIAFTAEPGHAKLRITAIEAETHPDWNPHFGVLLTDSDKNALYKASITARLNPLRLTDPQQLFGVNHNGKELGGALNIIEDFPLPEDLTIDFEIEWRKSGLVRASLNGRSLGFVLTASPHHEWSLFVSGMTISVVSSDVDILKCKT